MFKYWKYLMIAVIFEKLLGQAWFSCFNAFGNIWFCLIATFTKEFKKGSKMWFILFEWPLITTTTPICSGPTKWFLPYSMGGITGNAWDFLYGTSIYDTCVTWICKIKEENFFLSFSFLFFGDCVSVCMWVCVCVCVCMHFYCSYDDISLRYVIHSNISKTRAKDKKVKKMYWIIFLFSWDFSSYLEKIVKNPIYVKILFQI